MPESLAGKLDRFSRALALVVRIDPLLNLIQARSDDCD
jgi:hypothetical protein